MAKTLAEIRQARAALNTEAEGILAAHTDGGFTAEQDARLTAIKGELATLETERCAIEDAMSTTEQVAESVGKATAAATKRAADIAAACELAGKPARAHGFITSGKSAEAVTAELKAEANAPADEDVNTRNGRGAGKADTPASWNASIERTNRLLGVKTPA